jgi:hypothetical protein
LRSAAREGPRPARFDHCVQVARVHFMAEVWENENDNTKIDAKSGRAT